MWFAAGQHSFLCRAVVILQQHNAAGWFSFSCSQAFSIYAALTHDQTPGSCVCETVCRACKHLVDSGCVWHPYLLCAGVVGITTLDAKLCRTTAGIMKNALAALKSVGLPCILTLLSRSLMTYGPVTLSAGMQLSLHMLCFLAASPSTAGRVPMPT